MIIYLFKGFVICFTILCPIFFLHIFISKFICHRYNLISINILTKRRICQNNIKTLFKNTIYI
ncbi:hypothetical protein IMSAGC009_03598 [Lachnospiraceae bacterium]|nr:hypothetical protein IMSAGC009_03598 [Lachnospiraceae bacterium]